MDVVYSGIDTLDMAYRGAFSLTALDKMAEARNAARQEKADQLITLGPANLPFAVASHGHKGGYRYALTNGETGAIIYVKHSASLSEWNVFVSVRAACLLTRGYHGTIEWLSTLFEGMGLHVTGYSVHRIDAAVDIHTDDFTLDLKNVVAPSRMKSSVYWKDEEGRKHQAVQTGGKMQSVTIGKMPNRQIIIYDKVQAVIDKKQSFWFPAWGLDRETMQGRVWRIEIRFGRDALAKRIHQRSFEAVEAALHQYIAETLVDIRLVEDRDAYTNITRAPVMPIWELARGAARGILEKTTPPITEAHVLELMRLARAKMAIDQVTGCAVRAMALRGFTNEEIKRTLPDLIQNAIREDVRMKGYDWMEKKVRNTFDDLAPLLATLKPKHV